MTRSSTEHLSPSPAAAPSARLWAAALSGLVGLGGTACGSKAHVDPDPVPVDAAVPVDAPADAAATKVISETPGNHTFAEIAAMCEARHGYTQITAACAGMNSCAGFSYGDWDPGVLTEHSCNAVNGCNGISCVVLPADGGKQPADILNALEVPAGAPPPCANCHAKWSDSGVDTKTFKVWVLAGSGRTIDNWRDLSPEAQARIIAFGKVGQYADGASYRHMDGYHKQYSRAEIERLVEYIRTKTTIVVETIKTADAAPGPRAPGAFSGRRRR